MRTYSLLTILCIIATITFAQSKPTYTFALNGPSLDKYVYPNTNYASNVTYSGGGSGFISYDIKVNWTIQNGTISANGKSSKSTLSTPYGTTITIVWDDTPGNGKISAEVDYNNPNDKDLYSIKMDGPTSAQYPILSLKGAKTNFTAVANLFPLGYTQMKNVSVYPETEYSQIMEYDAIQGQHHRKAEQYEWTLPEGWRTAQNQTGTFITNNSSIDVYPNPVKGKKIKVRAANANQSSFSEVDTVVFARTLGYTAWPHSIEFGDTQEHAFNVEKISTPGIYYEWSAPAGWEINGGSNTLVTTDARVNIRVRKYTGDSQVKVRLKYNEDYSDWFPCPYKGIESPYVSCNKRATYRYEPVVADLIIPENSYSRIVWSTNGYLISGQGTTRVNVAPTSEWDLHLSANVTTEGYTAPSVFDANVTVHPNRMTLSGETDVYATNTYQILNRLPGTTVTWSLSDNSFTFLSSNPDQAVVAPLQYNQSATLTATLKNQYMNLPLQLNLKSRDMELSGYQFISGTDSRYTVNYVPYRASLVWSYAPGIAVKEKKDNYIVITGCEAVNPWIQAKVVSNGISTTRRMDLTSGNITGISLECLKTWRANVNGQYRKKYAFHVTHYPEVIPNEDLNFCWGNSISKKDINSSPLDPIDRGNTLTQTAGNRGLCLRKALNDLAYPTDYITPGNPFQPSDDLIPTIWTTSLDYAVYTLPDLTRTETCSGQVICQVWDNCNHLFEETYDVWDKWDYVYHVAPNPADRVLTLSKVTEGLPAARSMEELPKPLSVRLYNDYGISREILSDTSKANIDIDTSDLPDGNYYLNIFLNNEIVQRQVILIRH